MNANLLLLMFPLLLLLLPDVIYVEGLLHDSSLGGGEDSAVDHPDVKIKMRVVSINLSSLNKNCICSIHAILLSSKITWVTSNYVYNAVVLHLKISADWPCNYCRHYEKDEWLSCFMRSWHAQFTEHLTQTLTFATACSCLLASLGYLLNTPQPTSPPWLLVHLHSGCINSS